MLSAIWSAADLPPLLQCQPERSENDSAESTRPGESAVRITSSLTRATPVKCVILRSRRSSAGPKDVNQRVRGTQWASIPRFPRRHAKNPRRPRIVPETSAHPFSSRTKESVTIICHASNQRMNAPSRFVLLTSPEARP
jgi:hypothetical protein